MAVCKATVTMTVFFDEDDAPRFNGATLEAILYQVDEGDWIGSSIHKSEPKVVPDEELQQELEAIGNDGSFFDTSDVAALTRSNNP